MFKPAMGGLLVLAALAACRSSEPPSRAPGPGAEQRVVVERAAIVCCFPAVGAAPDEEDAALASALAHFSQAVAGAERCLGSHDVDVQRVLADRVTVERGSERIALPPDGSPDGIACVLAAPGRAAEVVTPPVGPSSLEPELLRVAARYFGVPSCAPSER